MGLAAARLGLLTIVVLAVSCGGDDGREGTPTTATLTAPVTSTDTDEEPDTSTTDETSESSTTDDPTGTTGEPTTDTTDSGDGPPVCRNTCTLETDCTVGGVDIGFDCVAGECVPACTSDEPCVAFQSGWTLTPCTTNAECELDVCVTFEGGSGCAFTPAAAACATLGLVEAQRMDVEGNAVTVCAQPTAICTDVDGSMQCHVPCTATSCGALTCAADGFCRCDDFVPCYTAGLGDICTAEGNCAYACTTPADCPETNVDGDQAACG